MIIDILFCAHGRHEFTMASLRQLLITVEDFKRAVRLVIYTDGDLKAKWICEREVNAHVGFDAIYETERLGGPVACMNHYLGYHASDAEFFAKIDNDVIAPPGWMLECVAVMKKNPELAILGLEPPASRTKNPNSYQDPPTPPESLHDAESGYARVDSVGGVFFCRTLHVLGRILPTPSGTRGGFTDWQQRITKAPLHYVPGQLPPLVIGWIVPPLKLFLLDRLPIEPWAGLSDKYERIGTQRAWTRYDPTREAELWGWWKP